MKLRNPVLILLPLRQLLKPGRCGQSLLWRCQRALHFLFVPPIFVLFLILISVAQGWLYFLHGMVRTINEVIYMPGQLLMVLVLFLIAGVFHEFGHASALRYGGGKVREMGVGIYLVF